MASDPTDLIREASEAVDGITPGEWEVGIHRGDDRDWCFVAPTGGLDGSILNSVDHVADECTEDDARFIAAAPDLVRRLRDALRAERKDSALFENLYDEAQAELAERFANKDRDRAALVELIAARAEYDEARAALAEANATIERVKALADTYGYTPNMTSVHHEIADQITRAIEGPALT